MGYGGDDNGTAEAEAVDVTVTVDVTLDVTVDVTVDVAVDVAVAIGGSHDDRTAEVLRVLDGVVAAVMVTVAAGVEEVVIESLALALELDVPDGDDVGTALLVDGAANVVDADTALGTVLELIVGNKASQ